MIVIHNWSDHDILHHSLVLLKGGVKDLKHGEISIEVNNGNRFTWPVVCYTFRALVELQSGENNIALQCGSETRQLKLFYERQKNSYFVRLVYIACRGSSGHFQGPDNEDCSIRSAQSKICFGAKVIQSLMAEKIADCGLKPRTFLLEEDQAGSVLCHVFHSSLTVEETHTKDEQTLWDHFALELMNSELKSEKCKFLAFLSSTRYTELKPGENLPPGHAHLRARTRGHVALGGGGLALIGTACLYTWPLGLFEFQRKLEDMHPVDITRFMDDSCNRSQLWACYISGLGASLHELAHTFDVGHSKQGIMGLGFHQLQQELRSCEQKKCIICSRNAHFKEKLALKNNQPLKMPNNSGVPVKPKLIQWTVPCPHCPDGPFWNPSEARILYYHKWFQPEDVTGGPVSWEATHKGWIVRSTNGLAVAELRNINGLVLAYWHHSKSEHFLSAAHFPRGPLSWNAVSLAVQDVKGNLLKVELSTQLQKQPC